MEDPSSCSKEEHESATLAYQGELQNPSLRPSILFFPASKFTPLCSSSSPVYLDRLLHFVSFYLFKLLASGFDSPIHIVFSGGIGERASRLRTDVVAKLAWLGVEVDEEANAKNGKRHEIVESISKEKKNSGGRLRVWVVKTDEEEQCARMAVSSVCL